MTSRRRTRVRPLLALAGVLGTLVLTGCEAYDLPLPGSPVDKDSSFEVTAEFRDVLQLVPRSPVKVNDVTVGEVVDVVRDGWNAKATLRLQDDVKLPENAIADIRQTSLLGEKYVALSAPQKKASGTTLHDGDTLSLAQTGRNPELEEVLGALAFLLNGGGVGQLKTITTEINKVFDGRQGRVRHVLGEIQKLVSGLDQQKGDIIRAMEAMNGLSSTLNREKATVTNAIDEFGPAVKVLADQHDQLIRMLRALDQLGEVGTRVVGATKDDLLADLRHLEPIVREIADVDDQLPEALGLLISFPFPIESNDIVHGDYANTSIVFSIDLNNVFSNATGGGNDGTGGGQLPNLPGLPGLPGLPDLPGLGGLLGGGGKGDGKGDSKGGGGLLGGLPGFGRAQHGSASNAGYATSFREMMGGEGS